MRTTPLEVQPVCNRRDARDFRELPFRLHRGATGWVPPLRPMEDGRWDPRHNPSLAGRWVQRFVARRDGRVVGRIAASIDPLFAERWAPASGFFGFFECERDEEAARALLRTAEAALGARGVEHVLGPVNLTTHDEVGLLVHGHERPVTLLATWSPPWYAELVESAGYGKCVDYHAYDWSPAALRDAPAMRLLPSVSAPGASGPLRIRAADPARWDAECRLLLELYNACFDDLWGFVPLSREEFAARAAEFRRFYRPELVWFATWEGTPVGFALALPDINAALLAAGGSLWPFGWWKLLRASRTLTRARLMLLGVRPEFRERRVAVALGAGVSDAAARIGVREAELSLIQEGNRGIQAVVAACGGTLSRTWRLYSRELGA